MNGRSRASIVTIAEVVGRKGKVWVPSVEVTGIGAQDDGGGREGD